MSEINFKIQPVGEKPVRKNRVTRKNKYEPIIDAFQGSEHSLVRVEGTHDDRFWALALAVYAAEMAPPPASKPIGRIG